MRFLIIVLIAHSAQAQFRPVDALPDAPKSQSFAPVSKPAEPPPPTASQDHLQPPVYNPLPAAPIYQQPYYYPNNNNPFSFFDTNPMNMMDNFLGNLPAPNNFFPAAPIYQPAPVYQAAPAYQQPSYSAPTATVEPEPQPIHLEEKALKQEKAPRPFSQSREQLQFKPIHEIPGLIEDGRSDSRFRPPELKGTD